ANVNDFAAGTAFHSIDLRAAGYQLTGNAIALAAGLLVEVPIGIAPSDTPVIGLPLTLTGDQGFTNPQSGYTVSGPVDLNGHALTVSGAGVTKIYGQITGAGRLAFGSANVLRGASTVLT